MPLADGSCDQAWYSGISEVFLKVVTLSDLPLSFWAASIYLTCPNSSYTPYTRMSCNTKMSYQLLTVFIQNILQVCEIERNIFFDIKELFRIIQYVSYTGTGLCDWKKFQSNFRKHLYQKLLQKVAKGAHKFTLYSCRVCAVSSCHSRIHIRFIVTLLCACKVSRLISLPHWWSAYNPINPAPSAPPLQSPASPCPPPNFTPKLHSRGRIYHLGLCVPHPLTSPPKLFSHESIYHHGFCWRNVTRRVGICWGMSLDGSNSNCPEVCNTYIIGRTMTHA